MLDNKLVTVGGGDPFVSLDDDGTLAGNSDKAVASQKAVKTYMDGLVTVPSVTATAAEINLVADGSAFTGSYTATSPAAIPATVRCVELNHATVAIEKTISSLVPYAGQIVSVKDTSATGTAAHTVTVTTGTWNGTNKVITLNALNEHILVFVDSAGNGTIIENVGGVALSG